MAENKSERDYCYYNKNYNNKNNNNHNHNHNHNHNKITSPTISVKNFVIE